MCKRLLKSVHDDLCSNEVASKTPCGVGFDEVPETCPFHPKAIEQTHKKECSEFVRSILKSFTYIKMEETFHEGVYNIAYRMEHDILVSITMHEEVMGKKFHTASINVYAGNELVLGDIGTLEVIDKYLKNVQDRINSETKEFKMIIPKDLHIHN